MTKIGYVIGKTNTRFATVINNAIPYIKSEYLIIKDDRQGDILCEVIATNIIPCIDDSILPEGCISKFAQILGMDVNKPAYLCTVKILKEIQYPIMPNSKVISAKYEEIANTISKAKVGDSMTIGIIKGTEHTQNDLPENMKNIAPLWENGKAVNQCGIPLLLNHHSFREYPHMGLFGSSGSGKSFAMRVILEELMKLGIPALCLDPHFEMSFEGTMNGLGDEFKIDYKSKYEEFIIGDNVGIKFTDLNFNELATLFEFIDGLTEPQRNALEILYEKGDTFKHLQQKITSLKIAFEKMEMYQNSRGKKHSDELELTPMETELYQKCNNKVSGNTTLQALSWKCISLENTGIFVADSTKVQQAMLQGKLAVVRGDISRLQMISSYLINKLYNKRRNYVDSNGDFFPPFFTVVDEAHNFASSEGKNTPTKSILRKIGQEARKYGVFLTLCTQRPKNLDSTLLAQLNTKFIFRLTDQTDIQVAKIEGNLTDEQAITLPDSPSGNCFISSAILNKTYKVRFRTTFSKAPNITDPFEELKTIVNTTVNELENILLKRLPIDTIKLAKQIPEIKKDLGQNITPTEIINCLDELSLKGKIAKIKAPGTGVKYKQV